jgi:hypothetical protein
MQTKVVREQRRHAPVAGYAPNFREKQRIVPDQTEAKRFAGKAARREQPVPAPPPRQRDFVAS